MDKSRIINDKAVEFVSAFDDTFYTLVRTNLAFFIENGFLKELFEKDSSVAVDKTQLLTKMFGDATDPVNFTLQAQAMNIQLLTLSLLYSMALYVSSRSWNNFLAHFYKDFGDPSIFDISKDDFDASSTDEPDKDEDKNFLGIQTPTPVGDMPPILPDTEMTPVDQTVIPENSWKKDKQKARITVDKQVKHQSTTAKPDEPKIPKRKRNHPNPRLLKY
ncbi:hypothetical protein RhiirA4_483309 [Rhizophagus irregularis]|uniref:Uncharacterized protein n=1 Tax=Rhizophagus irregularis TaxID=588596 RepID=A0A2I1HMF8_9GLOM|nr:hypothetical protein RhiirA4_483309 [Rhizophagus irregularis]